MVNCTQLQGKKNAIYAHASRGYDLISLALGRVQVLATGARKKIVWGTLDMGFIMDVDVGYAYIRSYEVREVSIVRYAQAYKPIINYTTLNGPHCTLSLPS